MKVSDGFKVILCDCPWRYDFSKTKTRKIENQYATLPVDHLCGLDVRGLFAKDAVIYFWATAPKLPEAFQVLEAWGFRHRDRLVWDKGKMGMGFWFRSQHELLLVGICGNVTPPPEEIQVASIIRRRKSCAKEEAA